MSLAWSISKDGVLPAARPCPQGAYRWPRASVRKNVTKKWRPSPSFLAAAPKALEALSPAYRPCPPADNPLKEVCPPYPPTGGACGATWTSPSRSSGHWSFPVMGKTTKSLDLLSSSHLLKNWWSADPNILKVFFQ